ncbi:3-hydroxyacyl-CoA dehydrogenase family protein [Mycobacteroides abscessus]|uniref:3-hydroxyacyl-CoA dehydrogenase family protein n=1 Tax=Mycobacteroides abscessus TaxID=36809 RepID=UPI00092A9786|nr:3-hydroxyacyl-CoA dehydrogenase NAD-binding domain-containing protein [Mycobacteroides abscessus]SIM82026.1 Putative dehydrogenase (3-hydroxybutyryl-CoA dehydrogenase FadB?) [Mycobacteroides abscessus subsp. abscessus]
MTYSPPTDIDNRPVAVLGAGTLGRRIALTFATRGGVVHLYDVSEESLQSAKEFLDQRIPELVKARSALGAQPATIEYYTDLPSAVKDAWYVVESVPEVQVLKIDMLGQLDEIAAPDAIIGTNSSSFMSSELIGKVKHPERFLNTHYGQPPEAPQAELVTDGHTDERIFDVLGATLNKAQIPASGQAGGEVTVLASGFAEAIGLAVDKEAGIAYVSDMSGEIRAVNLDGSGERTFAKVDGNLTGIVGV